MKNGFTLIELLAVIAILAIVLLIAVPKIIDVIETSKASALQSDEKMMKKAAEVYLTTNPEILPSSIGEEIKVSLEVLEDEKFISSIRDSSDECDGYVLVRKTETGEYMYKPYLICDNYSTEGIIAWYPLNSNGNDYSGNNYNATLTNVSFVEQSGINVASLNGTSQITTPTLYGTILLGTPPSSEGNYNDDVTLSAWVKLTEKNGNIIFDDSNSGEGQIRVYNDYITFGWGALKNYNVTLNLNEWYYLTLTHLKNDGTNAYISNLYIDGIKKDTVAYTISTSSVYYGPDGVTRIGSTFKGYLSDIYISNECLTAEEILENYNLTKYNRK